MKENKIISAGSIFTATILIVIGLAFFVANLDIGIGMDHLWPSFIFAVGLGFFLMFLFADSKKGKVGSLFPGTILLVISFLFYYLNFTDWSLMKYLWPTFILSVGMAFLVIYAGGSRKRSVLLSGLIISGIALIFYLVFTVYIKLWPLALVLAGLLIIFMPYVSQEKENS